MSHKVERIEMLDIVRGLAVLGILLMNVRLFSEPYAAYFNPLVWGAHEGMNKSWWAFQALFADQKFMAIFSMLFGASTAIICDGIARRQGPIFSTFGKRIIGLLLIGLAHAYLLWHGDILVPYAVSSMVPFLFRNVRWKIAAVAGIALLGFGTLWATAGYFYMASLPEHIQASLSLELWHPSTTTQSAEAAAFLGGWLDGFWYRAAFAFHFQTDSYLNWGLWRITGMMLLGLALYRQGFLGGQLSGRTYGIVALIALPSGLALAYVGLRSSELSGWSFPHAFLMATNWNYWGSVVIAIGYMAMIGFLLKATRFRLGFKALTNVGKAALSNYLFQSLACTSIFYGYGIGLFGSLERWQTAFVVMAVWTMQLALSHVWFKRHSQGPVEMLWHRFTHAKWL